MIEEHIKNYQLNTSQLKSKVQDQLNNLQIYLSDQLKSLQDQIFAKIDAQNGQIASNISHYESLSDISPSKIYFQNLLKIQLEPSMDFYDIFNEVQEIESYQSNENLQLKYQKQLKDVYTILKKAINLFTEQYPNCITNLSQQIFDFKSSKIVHSQDLIFSQDHQNTNIQLQKPYSCLSIALEKQLVLFPTNIDYQFTEIRCLSVLQDNRRCILCTKQYIVLIDIQTDTIIQYNSLNGDSPTCIQPLYGYYKPLNKPNLNDKIQRKQQFVAIGMTNSAYIIEICIFSLKNLQKVHKFTFHNRPICKLLQIPLDYNSLISVSGDRKINVWNLTLGTSIFEAFSEHSQSVNDGIIQNDNIFLSFSLNGEIITWNIMYENNKFKSLIKKNVISRSCLSLIIGYAISKINNYYFSVTSQGILEQIYHLEMNDFNGGIIFKQLLPDRAIAINVCEVSCKEIFVFVFYQQIAYFDIYFINNDKNSFVNGPSLYQRVRFENQEMFISNIIETPRVQFLQVFNQNSNQFAYKMLCALDKNLLLYNLQFN